MAFNTAPAAANNNNKDDAWKAQGFVNMYLPTKDGGKRKVGAIPLRDSVKMEREIRTVLETEGEEGLKRFANKLMFEYNSATPSEGSAIDL